uniref:Uncharacterized protein n=1 Tax=Arundo donax TaxID=35708 RepID=A0A0A9DR17_ARUDO
MNSFGIMHCTKFINMLFEPFQVRYVWKARISHESYINFTGNRSISRENIGFMKNCRNPRRPKALL